MTWISPSGGLLVWDALYQSVGMSVRRVSLYSVINCVCRKGAPHCIPFVCLPVKSALLFSISLYAGKEGFIVFRLCAYPVRRASM